MPLTRARKCRPCSRPSTPTSSRRNQLEPAAPNVRRNCSSLGRPSWHCERRAQWQHTCVTGEDLDLGCLPWTVAAHVSRITLRRLCPPAGCWSGRLRENGPIMRKTLHRECRKEPTWATGKPMPQTGPAGQRYANPRNALSHVARRLYGLLDQKTGHEKQVLRAYFEAARRRLRWGTSPGKRGR